MATLFIHAGMHKTGSSSIQATLAALPDGRRPHLVTMHGTANVSGVVREAFQDRSRMHASRGIVLADPSATAAAHRALLAQKLAAAADVDAIISGEGISSLSAEEFRDFLRLVRHKAVAITAYARQPYDLLPSQVQQRIKGGRTMSGRGLVGLRYRTACKKFTRFPFTLRSFERARLRNGCVVQDYLHSIGVEVTAADVINRNERLGQAATSLLCARNLWRAKRGMPQVDNDPIVPALRTIGGPTFELHPDIVRAAIARHQAEVDWIVKKLGREFIVETPASPNQLRSEADLLAFRVEAHAFLEKHDPQYDRSDDPEVVGEAMERVAQRLMAERMETESAAA